MLNEGSGMDIVDFSASGRSQFLQQLEGIIDELVQDQQQEIFEVEEVKKAEKPHEETLEDIVNEESSDTTDPSGGNDQSMEDVETMQRVMNQGLEFLSGMMKMATGKDDRLEGQKIEVDRETGEVVMRFKLPGRQELLLPTTPGDGILHPLTRRNSRLALIR